MVYKITANVDVLSTTCIPYIRLQCCCVFADDDIDIDNGIASVIKTIEWKIVYCSYFLMRLINTYFYIN